VFYDDEYLKLEHTQNYTREKTKFEEKTEVEG